MIGGGVGDEERKGGGRWVSEGICGDRWHTVCVCGGQRGAEGEEEGGGLHVGKEDEVGGIVCEL